MQLGNDSVGVHPASRGATRKTSRLPRPGAGATVDLSVYLTSDSSYHFIDQEVALTCPPPSSTRPLLPDILIETIGGCRGSSATVKVVVDASRATQPWTVDVYRIDKPGMNEFGPVQPGATRAFTVAKNVAHASDVTVEVAFVGPVRVDVGQIAAIDPITCTQPAVAIVAATTVVPGGTDQLLVHRFAPHESVHVTLRSAKSALEATLGTIRTDATGSGHLVFTVPVHIGLGQHLVFATDGLGEEVVVTIQVVAAPTQPAPPPSLAETGTHTAGLAALGFVLILSGAGVLVLARRRRTTS